MKKNVDINLDFIVYIQFSPIRDAAFPVKANNNTLGFKG